MRNLLLKVIRIIECLFGLFLLIGLCISINEFSDLYFWIAYIFLILVVFIPLEILYKLIKGKTKNLSQIIMKDRQTENDVTDDSEDIAQTAQSQFIEYGNIICRTNNEPISDEDIPYLMQLSFESSLQKNKIAYTGQVIDTSFIQEKDKNKAQYTRIPSYKELSMIEPAETAICSTDIFFLKYIDGLRLPHPFIAQYWYYDYGLNYSEEIKKLISNELLTFSTVNINKFTVKELKKVLRHFNLPLTGKKQALQERILSNISMNNLSNYLGNETQYFCATPKGSSLINTIHESATKNLELEDKCIKLIMKYDFQSAVSLIRNFKSSTPNGAIYIPYSDQVYMEIMDNTHFFHTLKKDRDLEPQIRAGVVFCQMYSCTQEKILKLIQRIYVDNNRDFNEYTASLNETKPRHIR